jgi:DNA-nicking Smr family endonuclease
MSTKDSKDSNSQDAALFREAMRDVAPIKSPSRAAVLPKRKPQRRPRATPVADTSASETGLGQRLFYKRPEVSKTQMRELSRGKMRVDAGIDLHGLKADRAARELASFLTDCLEKNIKCIRVVHGKGYGSGQRGPVLKALTDAYLRNCEAVLAFCSARDDDGGTGALYALLETR